MMRFRKYLCKCIESILWIKRKRGFDRWFVFFKMLFLDTFMFIPMENGYIRCNQTKSFGCFRGDVRLFERYLFSYPISPLFLGYYFE